MDTPNGLMREEERRNVSENHDWSKLYPDLLRSILESLNSIDFHRARTVCSDWYSIWKTCVKRPLCPWRIIYGKDSLMLLNPGEDKIYKGTNFVEPCRKDNVSKNFIICRRSAVLWIDERIGDYVVAWIFNNHYLFSYKKGDDSWWNWNDHLNMESLNLSFLDLAYRNSKLYLYTTNGHIKIVDFSGNNPIEVIEKNPYWEHPFRYFTKEGEYICKTRMAIQKSGEVLIILSVLNLITKRKLLFYIFKMNLESNIWERVESIGDDEMMIFGHGVTIRAPVQDVGDGIKSGSIYFARDDFQLRPIYYPAFSNCGVFDLATSIIKWLKEDSFNNRFVETQWFVPRFA